MKLFPNFTRHHLITHTNTTRDISKLSQIFTRLTAREITYNNFELSLVVFMPNITTNHAITYTNFKVFRMHFCQPLLKPVLVNTLESLL